jgi:hypothetical protein
MTMSLWSRLFGASGREPAASSAADADLKLVDAYLQLWDRFARGRNELVPALNKGRQPFEAALTRLLTVRDPRAPSRTVFSAVVQVGGSIPANSKIGLEFAAMAPECRVMTDDDGSRSYFAGDLYYWWRDHGLRYAGFPLFEEWTRRDFAQQTVIPIYTAACGRE